MKTVRVGVIGFGNMGKCIVEGLLRYGNIAAKNIFVYRRNQEKLFSDCKALGVNPCKEAKEVVKQADLIVLAVNPGQMETVLKEIKSEAKGKTFVSIMASKVLLDFDQYLSHPKDFHVVISIPKTPIKVGEGILITSKKHRLNKREYEMFKDTFSKIALIQEVEEEMLSVYETIAGCSPAFVFMMMQAMSDSATAYGIPRDENYPLIAKMVLGSAKLMLETRKHPCVLKEEVASPKGTTIKGIIALEKKGFNGSIQDAYEAIFQKNKYKVYCIKDC